MYADSENNKINSMYVEKLKVVPCESRIKSWLYIYNSSPRYSVFNLVMKNFTHYTMGHRVKTRKKNMFLRLHDGDFYGTFLRCTA